MNFDFNKQPGLKLNNKFDFIMDKPLITIVTPFFNATKYFHQTFNSVQNQTFPYFEWIIVNDGSTDKFVNSFLKKYADRDKRIKIINIENNGPGKARFEGIKNSQTDYILFLDSDDLIEPVYLECAYFNLETNKDVSWTYSNSIGFEKENYLWNVPFDIKLQKRENLLVITALVRKKVLLNLDFFKNKNQKNIHEDYYMWNQMLLNNCYPSKMTFYGFWYRRLNGRMNLINKKTTNSNLEIIKFSKKISNKIKAKNFSHNYLIEYKKEFVLNNYKVIYPGKVNVILTDHITENIINKMNKNINYIIICTNIIPLDIKQKFDNNVYIYELNAFLSKENWLPFINYMVKTKNINLFTIYETEYNNSIKNLINCDKLYNEVNEQIIYDENKQIEYLNYLKKSNIKNQTDNYKNFKFRLGYKLWKNKLYRTIITFVKSGGKNGK